MSIRPQASIAALSLCALAGVSHAQITSIVGELGYNAISSWDFGNIVAEGDAALTDRQLGRAVRLFRNGRERAGLADAGSDISASNATDINGFNSDFLDFTTGGSKDFGLIDHNEADQIASGGVFLRGVNTGKFNSGSFGEALVSKDANGLRGGGDFTISFVRESNTTGYIQARLQDPDNSETIISSEAIPLGLDQFVDVVVTFGADLGFKLYIDRDLTDDAGPTLEAESTEILTGLENNVEPWIIGSSAVQVSPAASTRGGMPQTGDLRDGLSGGIAGFSVFAVPAPATTGLLLGAGLLARRRR